MLAATAALGVIAAVLVVGAGATFQSAAERRVLGGWLDAGTFLWRQAGGGFQDRWGFVTVLVLLVLSWCATGWRLSKLPTDGCSGRWTLLLAAPALPFALSPPFMSKDAYAYVAQGRLLLQGGSPYHEGVSALGPSSTLAAVDPLWRATTSPYGPLALRLQELAVWLSGGRELVALAVLRTVVVVCVVGSVLAVRRLAPAALRTRATWLACSPLLLVHVIAPLHLEAVISVLVLSAFLLYVAGYRFWAGAVVIGAAEIKVTALLALAVLVLHTASSQGRACAARLLAGAVGAAAASVLLLPSDPFGWLRGLGTPGRGWAPYTPASAAVSIVDELLDLLSVRNAGWLVLAARAVFAVAGAVLLVVVLCRSRQGPVRTAGLSTLVAAAAGPVMWPWYLSPASLLLAPSQSWVLSAVLGGGGALLALPLGTATAERVGLAAVVATGLGVLLWRRRPA